MRRLTSGLSKLELVVTSALVASVGGLAFVIHAAHSSRERIARTEQAFSDLETALGPAPASVAPVPASTAIDSAPPKRKRRRKPAATAPVTSSSRGVSTPRSTWLGADVEDEMPRWLGEDLANPEESGPSIDMLAPFIEQMLDDDGDDDGDETDEPREPEAPSDAHPSTDTAVEPRDR